MVKYLKRFVYWIIPCGIIGIVALNWRIPPAMEIKNPIVYLLISYDKTMQKEMRAQAFEILKDGTLKMITMPFITGEK